MRLWHEALIPYLPRQQLLGLHSEICALRGNGWGKPHSTVDYVFHHPYGWLVVYHQQVIKEMQRRGYNANLKWLSFAYQGKKMPELSKNAWVMAVFYAVMMPDTEFIYPEHNAAYLQECLDDLARKGIKIEMEEKHGG